MTAYITTPEQHAQIVDALETARTTAMDNVMAARIPECGDFAAIAQNLDWSVATLKAMTPVEVEAYLVYDPAACSEDLFFDGELGDVDGKTVTPLYAKEQQ